MELSNYLVAVYETKFDGTRVAVVSKSYWEKEHCLSDQHIDDNDLWSALSGIGLSNDSEGLWSSDNQKVLEIETSLKNLGFELSNSLKEFVAND